MNVADYAIPVSCKTAVDCADYVLQFAVMANSNDAKIYAKNCRKYGAYADVNGVYVWVTYYKDENGKIGPKWD
jgi:hypothetical protein